jgi:hypothetical protein
VTRTAPDPKDEPSDAQTILSAVFTVMTASFFTLFCAWGHGLVASCYVFFFFLYAILLGEGLGRRAALRAGLTPVPSFVHRNFSKWFWKRRAR